MRHFIYSTMTNDHDYTNWKPQSAPGQALEVDSHVLIKGGANRPDTRLMTPKGVMTQVTDAEMEALERNVQFNRHKKQGLIVVSSSKDDAEDIALGMTPKDNSAPLTDDSPIFNPPPGEDADLALKPKKNKAK